MIYEKIEVKYYIRKDNRKIFFDYKKIAEPGEKAWLVDTIDRTEKFTVFTNKGKVSKSQRSKYDVVNEEAERKLQERLALKAQTAIDLPRAIELAKVVDKAFEDKMNDLFLEYDYLEEGDFDDSKTPGWVTIKIKTSHSNWYDNDDVFNAPSTYHYQVPIEVEKEARELQAIRRKHQGDNTFRFWECDYRKREVRVADHSNY
ncbi:hypothetical protein ACNYMP_05585 [Ligilactobacillus salivarius]|uniref:hypothetical protein n=1 Tax=Ligilactobacillus salivarius TaxID=1624 RepID=UPI00189A745C|nr:hypothetical protein [Ligilactobacillus salivarius]MDE7523159.1 hypothetical protein [Ligilactobacillus salivarius]